MKKTAIFALMILLLTGPAATIFAAAKTDTQYQTLLRDIARRSHIAKHTPQTFNPEALILDSDRDPLDIVLRRSAALLNDLRQMSTKPNLASLEKKLIQLTTDSAKIKPAQTDARYDLFKKATALRRKLSFANPLLDFDQLLFIKRHRATFNHMCDQYYGINVLPGGGVCVLSDPFVAPILPER